MAVMAEISEATIRQALGAVLDPQRGQDVIALNMVSGISIHPAAGGAQVRFALEVDPQRGAALETLRQAAEQAVRQMPGVADVTVVLTAHRAAPPPKPARQPHGGIAGPLELPDIRHIVAVASGKGGVGKSTTAVNLALALAGRGLRVGLFDADIYGPSVPMMLGITAKPELREDKKLESVVAHGLKVMSIGFLLAEPDGALVWRGPMVQGAIQQMLRDVAWGPLDVMLVDLPPGTGDAQLAITQLLKLSGAIIVSTPQDIALLDAKRGLKMFQKVTVPVLGLIENMSGFLCPHCGERSDIFGHGGAQTEAARLGIPFLGAVPLELAIRQSMDDGQPIMIRDPACAAAKIYGEMAEQVWRGLTDAAVKERR